MEDVTGAVDVARWSPQAGKWVSKDGAPINAEPTHWYSETEDSDPEGGPLGIPLGAGVILLPAILIGAALLGVFDTFGARAIPETTQIGGESALSLDQRPEIGAGSQALLQREASGALTYTVPAGMVQPEPWPDRDALHSHARASELDGARRELDEAVQHAQAAKIEADELRQSLQQEQARNVALANDVAEFRREIDARDAGSRKAEDVAAQQREAAQREIAELEQSLQRERENSAVRARQVNAAQAAAASAEQERHEAQSRAAALASELAGMPRHLPMTEAATAEQSPAAGPEIAELRQSLQQEQEKNAALVTEAKAAQAAAVDADQQRRALEQAQAHAAALESELAEVRREIETRNVQFREAENATRQQRQAAEREISELRQSLKQELSKTEARERDLARRSTHERVLAERANAAPVSPATRSVEVAAPPTDAVKNEAEARLIPRARALLDQGNIGAARIVLELAAEKDIARASFMLAETYDPAVLSAWGTYGTRGEAAKARELYAKAHRGGIREAKERLDALRP
ncbi:coiled-coil domain-containing protein [Bradyrhizobium sp. 25ACV]